MIKIHIRENLRTILLIIAGLALLSVVISVIIALVSGGSGDDRSENPMVRTESLRGIPPDELEVRGEHLMLTPSIQEYWRGEYRPRRPRRDQWGMDELRQYWYDPRELGSESLRRSNEELIDELLKSYR